MQITLSSTPVEAGAKERVICYVIVDGGATTPQVRSATPPDR